MSIDRGGENRVIPSAAGNYPTIATGGWVPPTGSAQQGATRPLSPDDFLPVRSFNLACPQGQHTYAQGEDTEGQEMDNLRLLLFCRGCGDIIRFALPADDK